MLLIKLIGIRGLNEPTIRLKIERALEFLPQLSRTIPLLFLESLGNPKGHPPFEAQLSRHRDKHRKTLDLTALVSSPLEASDICYILFKTLKPFPYTQADNTPS